MWRETTVSDQYHFDMAAYRDYFRCDDNSKDKKQMLSILCKALKTELTERQRYCLEEYYLRGRKMKDIAESLNLSPSTVTRHIRRATEKLRHIADYYQH